MLKAKALSRMSTQNGPDEPALSKTKSLPDRLPLSVRVKPPLVSVPNKQLPKVGLESVCFHLKVKPECAIGLATMEQLFVYKPDPATEQGPLGHEPVDIEYLFPSPGCGMPIIGFECEINGNKLDTQVDRKDIISEKVKELDSKKITYAKMETKDQDSLSDLIVVSIGSLKPHDVLAVRVQFAIELDIILESIYRITIPVVLLPRLLVPRPINEQNIGKDKGSVHHKTLQQSKAQGISLSVASGYTVDFSLTAENFKGSTGSWELRFPGFDDQTVKSNLGDRFQANFSQLKAHSPNVDLDFELEWKDLDLALAKSALKLDRNPLCQIYSPIEARDKLTPLSGLATIPLSHKHSQLLRLEEGVSNLLHSPDLRESLGHLDLPETLETCHEERVPGDYSQLFVLVLDHSQFIKENKLHLLLQSAHTCLKMLPQDSWVAIARIGLAFDWIFQAPIKCNPESIQEIWDSVKAVMSYPENNLGGLDLSLLVTALDEIDNSFQDAGVNLGSCKRQAILFSCGNITDANKSTEQIVTQLQEMKHPFRLSTIGIGGGSVYYLLKKLAKFGGGVHEVVTERSTITRRMFFFLYRLTSSVVEHPKLNVPPSLEYIDLKVHRSIGLLAEEQYKLMVFSQASLDPKQLKLVLTTSKQTLFINCETSDSDDSAKLHKVLVHNLLSALDSQLLQVVNRQIGPSEEKTEIAISHQLLTPEVSFLAVVNNPPGLEEPLEQIGGAEAEADVQTNDSSNQPFVPNKKIIVAGTVGQDYLKKAQATAPIKRDLFANSNVDTSTVVSPDSSKMGAGTVEAGAAKSFGGTLLSGKTGKTGSMQKRVKEEALQFEREQPRARGTMASSKWANVQDSKGTRMTFNNPLRDAPFKDDRRKPSFEYPKLSVKPFKLHPKGKQNEPEEGIVAKGPLGPPGPYGDEEGEHNHDQNLDERSHDTNEEWERLQAIWISESMQNQGQDPQNPVTPPNEQPSGTPRGFQDRGRRTSASRNQKPASPRENTKAENRASNSKQLEESLTSTMKRRTMVGPGPYKPVKMVSKHSRTLSHGVAVQGKILPTKEVLATWLTAFSPDLAIQYLGRSILEWNFEKIACSLFGLIGSDWRKLLQASQLGVKPSAQDKLQLLYCVLDATLQVLRQLRPTEEQDVKLLIEGGEKIMKSFRKAMKSHPTEKLQKLVASTVTLKNNLS